jgi:spatacsin
MAEDQPVRKITEAELLPFVLDHLHNNRMRESFPVLQQSFPQYAPLDLFRTIVLQQAWCQVCSRCIEDASKLIEELGELPARYFHSWWRNTTRNSIRELLYDFLSRQSLLSVEDERHHQALLAITGKYPNSSFTSVMSTGSLVVRMLKETAKQSDFGPILSLSSDFIENSQLLFPTLFKIPAEPQVTSKEYFIGNIALIEAQDPFFIKVLLKPQGISSKLWLLHCQHNVLEMASIVKDHPAKGLKFVNRYVAQFSSYEAESVLDSLCTVGYFCDEELNEFEKLIVRICKVRVLFDADWWDKKSKIGMLQFFKQFAAFCGKRNLFMPFEMFVVRFPQVKEFDLSEVKDPLIQFIWELWVKRNETAASNACMQIVGNTIESDPVKLWTSLRGDSLAPLTSFIFGKLTAEQTEALSARLEQDFPLLANLVKGEIPHPLSGNQATPSSSWRSPVFTSIFDMEVHDAIKAQFDFDFS